MNGRRTIKGVTPWGRRYYRDILEAEGLTQVRTLGDVMWLRFADRVDSRRRSRRIRRLSRELDRW